MGNLCSYMFLVPFPYSKFWSTLFVRSCIFNKVTSFRFTPVKKLWGFVKKSSSKNYHEDKKFHGLSIRVSMTSYLTETLKDRIKKIKEFSEWQSYKADKSFSKKFLISYCYSLCRLLPHPPLSHYGRSEVSENGTVLMFPHV